GTGRARSTASRTSTCAGSGGVRCWWSRCAKMSAWKASRHERHPGSAAAGGGPMSAEDLEKYETDMELQLYREYRDIVRQFAYVVETERRFYLANAGDL